MLCGLAIFLAGLISGRSLSSFEHAQTQSRLPVPSPVPSATVEASLLEVSGFDVADLPRYPGSTRTIYRHAVYDSVTVTEVEYMVDSDVTAIRDYYRQIFDANRWSVVDSGFFAGEWKFVVMSGEREAVLEIDLSGPLTEYEIKLVEPD